jgi:hypothetical protein
VAASIPAWPKGKPFGDAPTFEQLKQRSGFNVTQLREKLRDVPRFKCADNTVRYDAAAAELAIDGADPMSDEVDDAGAAAAVSDPLPADPVQAAIAVMNRTLSLFSVVVRERGEIVKLCNDTIKTMSEPLKLGQELVREGCNVMRERLAHYDAMWDRMVLLVEDLQSTKAERDREAIQRGEQQRMRGEAFDLAKQYLPTAIDKFSLTFEAQAAVDLLRGIDPAYLEPMLELGVLPKDLEPKARRLIEVLKARKRSNGSAAAADDPPPTPRERPPKETPS